MGADIDAVVKIYDALHDEEEKGKISKTKSSEG